MLEHKEQKTATEKNFKIFIQEANEFIKHSPWEG